MSNTVAHERSQMATMTTKPSPETTDGDCKDDSSKHLQRKVLTPNDMKAWEKSTLYLEVFAFIINVNSAIRNTAKSDHRSVSEVIG